jgi:DNA processing protein
MILAMDRREKLALYAYEYGGEWPQIARAIKEERQPMPFHIRERYLTVLDSEYPASLRRLRFPPWVIFYEGDISMLNRPMITIVGSRNMTARGETYTKKAASVLSTSHVLVSGLAKGVDACVHQTAMQNGNTIAVIGSGLGTHYPHINEQLYAEISKNDLILSEYPWYAGVQKYHFPWRNRILAALGKCVIVTQAEIASGTMLTVNEAISLSKDIWCFPYPFEAKEGSGCNHLISQGAGILYETAQLRDIAVAVSHNSCKLL